MRNLLKQHGIKTPAPASNWRKSSLELLLQMTKPSSSSEKQTFHSNTDSAPKHLQILSKSQQGSCAMRGTISIKHSSHLSSSFCFQSIVPPSLPPHQENRQEDETPVKKILSSSQRILAIEASNARDHAKFWSFKSCCGWWVPQQQQQQLLDTKNTPPVHNSQPNRTKCSPKRVKFSSWFTRKSSKYLVIKSTTGMRSQFEENRSSRAGDKPPRCPLPCPKPLRIFRSQSTWHVPIVYHGISSHLGTSIETSLVDSPRDRSRFSGPGCVISRDPIKEGTSIETSFVDSQSTRRVPVVYFIVYRTSIETLFVDSESMRQVRIGYLGIFITYGTSIETSLVDFQSTWQVPIVYLGISSPVGPRWWVDFALQNPSFVQAVQIIIY